MEEKSILKKIDEFLFKSIDNLLAKPELQNTFDQLSSLDEEVQKFINQALSVIFVLLPIVGFSYVVYKNYEISQTVENKRLIMNSISSFLEKSSESHKLQTEVLSKSMIKSKNDFESRLLGLFPSGTLPPKSLEFVNFRQHSPTKNLTQSNVDIIIKGITPELLTSLTDKLINREKVKIAQVQIEKDPKTSLLKGKMHVIHFGKVASK
ncbi:MAG: hypothetical protein OEY33_01305 [Bdellovibrionales bacterium]|jgi:hypothetical protein|nr:hypothetical protein [Bdellovibrionales bacterium]